MGKNQTGLVVREKFGLLCDLGVVVVPDNYTPFVEFEGGKFPNPTRVLRPGDRLWVRAHKQIRPGTTTSEEHLDFLASLNSYLVSAAGALLVFKQKRILLPAKFWYGSFDKQDRLWKDDERQEPRVPGILVGAEKQCSLNLGYYQRPWYDLYAPLSFCDEPEHLMGLS